MWESERVRGALDAAGRAWPRPELRAGTADRQRVVDELQRHYVDGRLTADELGERVSQATAARTFGELQTVLADLPPLDGFAAPSAPDRPARPTWPTSQWGLPVGVVMALLAVLLVVWLVATPGLHMGFVPIWPLFIWGFFFIGRPGRRPR
jgi:hypothetical protein